MYYCKNCGEAYMTDEAVMCVKCGVAKGRGLNYCHNCGKALQPGSGVCLSCGVPSTTVSASTANGEAKSKIAAGLLGIFLGGFGIHNFYLGYTSKAITQLVLTIVGIVLSCIVVGVFLVMGVSIWGLVEGIMILTGKINTDANGIPLTE
ncbi:MAG: TM2 domain-containing protein [Lachnospiraceae bacterium]|nr:TM2 domain-containing protein [Lachnospiraceae bacterium]